MEQTKKPRHIVSKAMYEAPLLDIVCFSGTDIITTSGNGDENQGEWDPQNIDNIF